MRSQCRRKQLPAWILRVQLPHDGTLPLVVPKTREKEQHNFLTCQLHNIFWRLFALLYKDNPRAPNSETKKVAVLTYACGRGVACVSTVQIRIRSACGGPCSSGASREVLHRDAHPVAILPHNTGTRRAPTRCQSPAWRASVFIDGCGPTGSVGACNRKRQAEGARSVGVRTRRLWLFEWRRLPVGAWPGCRRSHCPDKRSSLKTSTLLKTRTAKLLVSDIRDIVKK